MFNPIRFVLNNSIALQECLNLRWAWLRDFREGRTGNELVNAFIHPYGSINAFTDAISKKSQTKLNRNKKK
jgi:hypothetical protein